MSEEVFGDQPINQDVTLETLVGEDRKYKDPDSLAKAYANIEGFAETLKRDNAELRAKLDLNSNSNNQQQQPPAQTPANTNADSDGGRPEKVDFKELIRSELEVHSRETTYARNIEETAAKLVESVGSAGKAQEAIAQKARDLGVTVEFMRDMAAKTPNGFYAVMGIDKGPGSSNTPSHQNEMRTIPNSNTGKKTYSHYQSMRKENPNAYWSIENQSEMQKSARDLGEAFYS